MRIYTARCEKIGGPKIPVRIRFRQKAVRMEADGKSVNANDVLRAEMEAYKRGDMSALAMHALTNYDSSADYWKLMEDGSLAYDGDGWLKDSNENQINWRLKIMKKTQQHSYKTIDFPPLTDEQKKELEYLNKMPDNEIDYSDIPEQLDTPVVSYYFKSLKMPKTDIHTKIDNDNLAWLKQGGRGYQARLNNVIRWARLNNCPIIQM